MLDIKLERSFLIKNIHFKFIWNDARGWARFIWNKQTLLFRRGDSPINFSQVLKLLLLLLKTSSAPVTWAGESKATWQRDTAFLIWPSIFFLESSDNYFQNSPQTKVNFLFFVTSLIAVPRLPFGRHKSLIELAQFNHSCGAIHVGFCSRKYDKNEQNFKPWSKCYTGIFTTLHQ